MTGRGWIGVDLDGTLAHYDGWKGVDHIGAPVPEMLARVRAWLAEGRDVRIFTARVAGPDAFAAQTYIATWLVEHIGAALPVTNVKDFGMVELWDDRAVQVVPNEGSPYRPPVSVTRTAHAEAPSRAPTDYGAVLRRAADVLQLSVPPWPPFGGTEEAARTTMDADAVHLRALSIALAAVPSRLLAEMAGEYEAVALDHSIDAGVSDSEEWREMASDHRAAARLLMLLAGEPEGGA